MCPLKINTLRHLQQKHKGPKSAHTYIFFWFFVFVVLQFLEPCQDTLEQNMGRDMARTELEEEGELKARAVADAKK